MLELLLVEDLPAPVHRALLAFAHALPCERARRYRTVLRALRDAFGLETAEIAWLVREEKDRDSRSQHR